MPRSARRLRRHLDDVRVDDARGDRLGDGRAQRADQVEWRRRASPPASAAIFVATTVAIRLAVSWKPLMYSKTSAAIDHEGRHRRRLRVLLRFRRRRRRLLQQRSIAFSRISKNSLSRNICSGSSRPGGCRGRARASGGRPRSRSSAGGSLSAFIGSSFSAGSAATISTTTPAALSIAARRAKSMSCRLRERERVAVGELPPGLPGSPSSAEPSASMSSRSIGVMKLRDRRRSGSGHQSVWR